MWGCKHFLWVNVLQECSANQSSQSSMQAEQTDPDLLLLRITLILKPRAKKGGEQT